MNELSVSITPHGWTFDVKDGETVLDAALRQGVSLRYGCRHGNCSTCKYEVIDGDVDVGIASPYSLPEPERAEGMALLCCAYPLTDIVIHDEAEVDDRQAPMLPITETTASVESIVNISSSLSELSLTLDEPMKFYAGQFVELEVPGYAGVWRSYSIASSPQAPSKLKFIVKRIEGGLFSGRLDVFEVGTQLGLRGPYGSSYLRPGDRPVVMVAAGSGIAPILSMLADAAAQHDPRTFTFFYGARTRADLVKVASLSDLANRLDLTVVMSLSQPTQDCEWTGPVGRVTRAVQSMLADAIEHDAYLCGAPQMCDSIALLLEAKGIRESRIFFDKFYAATTSQ
jgi:NAD(P)H-flavin reductase/ferredoxin